MSATSQTQQHGLITAQAPSNIALVKYMGKTSTDGNLPANGSLSMTLDSLCTWARVRERGSGLTWNSDLFRGDEKVGPYSLRVPELSQRGKERILRHLSRVLEEAPAILSQAGLRSRVPHGLELGAANTFPAASGIASSASSFAAVTWAGVAACAGSFSEFQKAWETSSELRRSLAKLSRKGSGSSCRSMEGPWVRWEGQDAWKVAGTSVPDYTDLVLLAGKEEKEVSSSEAHARVMTSPLWQGRVERATARLGHVEAALSSGDINSLAEHVWQESWEMHSLFHTASPPFTYWLPRSVDILRFFTQAQRFQDLPRPVVTMDAGPNVHVLVPTVSAQQWRARIESAFPHLEILEDRCGTGARGWWEGQ